MYDYIITGGGPAGCVLANRLTANPDISVLLLESGNTDYHPLIHMPAGFAKLTGETATWGYSTVPQQHLNNREMWYPQGRVLGGGSSINAQVYTRGHPSDYDEWAAEEGCEGWSFDEVLPYFRKAEDNIRLVNRFHGVGGPLQVSDPVPHPLTNTFVRAAQEAGFPFSADFNGAVQEGFGYYQLTNRAGKRCSAAAAYIKPVLKRSNLTIITKATVKKILIENDRAVGVQYVQRGSNQLFSVRAQQEVLVTSGAVGSPKLLLLSGIGPANHLKNVGVDVVHDLPGVGENFHDHMDVFVVSECSGDYSFDRYKPWYMNLWAGLQYLLFKTGPVASNLCDGGGFWYADKASRSPDIQFHFLPGSGLEHGLKQIRNGVTLNSALLRPKSRGTVRLRSATFTDTPLIDPNYWAEEYDRRLSVEGFKLARDIMAQPAFRPFIKGEVMPGADAKTDQQIMEYAKQFSKTDYHPVGACKMGAVNDEWSVVGPDLRVRGIDGLRVMDSSVMPRVVSANTNAATIMIAEKGAALILKAK
ncbi:choline dehydrogenase [Endozoicomonas sp. SM1973]|uniref:Choline dehydrogenase n=1 Tax=Spartinivicinus marinus TaxID=2994442 RepID=A0A853HU81_9GAMM|nr:choline dehydrogenase [Spartinivicinus marinus]MCX4029923.1 choline dehydrogenase [Spartinivicinus marinus]NYZ64833.1 choline dehydrogenase [Spartinivicinus marinus]